MCIWKLSNTLETKLTLPAALQIFPGKVHVRAWKKPVQIFGLFLVLERIWYSVHHCISPTTITTFPVSSLVHCYTGGMGTGTNSDVYGITITSRSRFEEDRSSIDPSLKCGIGTRRLPVPFFVFSHTERNFPLHRYKMVIFCFWAQRITLFNSLYKTEISICYMLLFWQCMEGGVMSYFTVECQSENGWFCVVHLQLIAGLPPTPKSPFM